MGALLGHNTYRLSSFKQIPREIQYLCGVDQVPVTFEDLETNAPLHTSARERSHGSDGPADRVTVEQVQNIATVSFRQPKFHHLVHTGVLHVKEAGSTRIGEDILFCKLMDYPDNCVHNIVRETAIASVLLAWQDGAHNF